jgi:hypothetical protein
MLTRNLLPAALLGLGLIVGVGAPAGAADPAHSHHAAPGAALELQLDNGARWPTDEALRRGMNEMREAMAAALPRIHAGALPRADYAALADRVQAQVDYVVENCRLPEAADAQLHLVIAQILDGIGVMKDAGADGAEGAVVLIRALDAYGDAFDHPGWTPIAH